MDADMYIKSIDNTPFNGVFDGEGHEISKV